MRPLNRRQFRRFAGSFIVLMLLGALGGLLLAWSGVYSVAASSDHWKVVEWFLHFGMRNSAETHARSVDASPPLDNVDLYRLGAAHFHGGCAYCHGAPGMPVTPVARSMLPPPPPLSGAALEWKDRELFWLVKHGIKYTGMPAWPTQQRDDEVWAVVAFLRQLPKLDAHGYRNLAIGDLPKSPQSGAELATTEASSEAVSACGRCHGAEQRPPTSDLVPILHGQSVEFLQSALQAYVAGRRESGIMQQAVSELDTEALERVARYYAGLQPPPHEPKDRSVPDATAIERGRRLAMEGAPAERIPSCWSCHADNALAVYPRLGGQNAAYMSGQLRLWKQGAEARTDTAAVMAPIARLLSEQQIADVTTFFSSLRPQSR